MEIKIVLYQLKLHAYLYCLYNLTAPWSIKRWNRRQKKAREEMRKCPACDWYWRKTDRQCTALQLPARPFGKSRLENGQKRWEVKKLYWWELKYFVVLYQGKNGAVAVLGRIWYRGWVGYMTGNVQIGYKMSAFHNNGFGLQGFYTAQRVSEHNTTFQWNLQPSPSKFC